MPIRISDPVLCGSADYTPAAPLAAYDATTDTVLDIGGLKEKALMVKNSGGAAATYTILGSLNDGLSYDFVVKADTVVNAAALDTYRDSVYYTHWKVRVKGVGSAPKVTIAGIGV